MGNGSRGSSDPSPRAFRWTEQKGFDLLSGAPYYSGYSVASGVSADGSTICGESAETFIWDAAHGPRSLSGVLLDEYGLNTEDFLAGLGQPSALSADGRVIVGTGERDLGGAYMAWRAVIPEPSTTALLTTGLVGRMFFVRRRRNRIHV